MSSSDRIELSIDPGTWDPMDEDMVSIDPIEFHSEEEPYEDRIDSYQRETGLTEAVQTGIGQLNGIPIAIGVMDFQFMGGSMGSAVGEKLTRLVEYATNRSLPLIIVCASGGARMQEGSLSLMQMAKISSASYNYQSNKKLFYVSILTSPTTGGVTASFGMLGDIIIAEPNAYIAFAGKRVIEQTLNKTVPEGSQVAEYLFHKGLFDSIVPRNLLKGLFISSYLWCTILWNVGSGYDRFDRKEGIVCIFRWGFPGINRRIFLQFFMRDIQSIRVEVQEGLFPRRVLYMEIGGRGTIPLTRTDENLTPREIEQKAAELAYFLRVPIEGYENPREATGRIVCANCHLANKPVDIEVPQAVLPDTVFEAVVRIPYDMQVKQVLANGKKGALNSYNPTKKNILVIGPVPGKKYSEITFPILSPDPTTKKDVHFLKYPIYVGGNRGRGQIYPDGSKSNNTVYNATAAGVVSKIVRKEKGGSEITIKEASDGHQVVDLVPPGPELLVSEGESIKLDQPLTSNPNVGGFGQGDAEIVLQDPSRVQGLFFLGICYFGTNLFGS
ncbi:hypothetical protein Scep_031009 [Stephania cephalantha]|uniref:Cytochrome f n=1 Tax=Stephania cephalantha TaxID=152367 RepID=A0AAP0DTX1_9MAGN